jgi:hypothetical protein
VAVAAPVKVASAEAIAGDAPQQHKALPAELAKSAGKSATISEAKGAGRRNGWDRGFWHRKVRGYGWRIEAVSSFGADGFERGDEARESPGEIRNLLTSF